MRLALVKGSLICLGTVKRHIKSACLSFSDTPWKLAYGSFLARQVARQKEPDSWVSCTVPARVCQAYRQSSAIWRVGSGLHWRLFWQSQSSLRVQLRDTLRRSTSVSGMAEEYPAAADQLEGDSAQPFTAGSRPVDWLQANRAWRNLGASGDQSLSQRPGASQSSSMSQPGRASYWTLPQHSAQPAAGLSNAAPFASSFPSGEAAADRQEKRKFQPAAERTKAAGLSGSSLLFSNSSSARAPRSFLRMKDLSEPQSQPSSQTQASAMPSAADSMYNGGPSSPCIHTSVPAEHSMFSNASVSGTSGDGMHSHHGQKRSASAASLGGIRSRDGAHDATAASNGNANQASSTGNHGWTGASLQDHLKAASGIFAAPQSPEKAPFEASSSRPSSTSAQPKAGVFKWPSAFTAQASMQSNQASGGTFSADSGSAVDPSKPGSISSQAGMPPSCTAGAADRLPGRVSRPGWSGNTEKAPVAAAVAAAAAPAPSVNAVGQSQQDQPIRNAGPAAGTGRSRDMMGSAKDASTIQAPFVFGSTGTPSLPPQANQNDLMPQHAFILCGSLLLTSSIVNDQHVSLLHVAATDIWILS